MLMAIEIVVLDEYFISISNHLIIFSGLYPTLTLLFCNSLLLFLNNLIQLLYPSIVLRNVGQHLILISDPLFDEFIGCE